MIGLLLHALCAHCDVFCCFSCVCSSSYYGYSVSRRVGGQLFTVLVVLLLLLLLAIFAFKLSQSDSLGFQAAKMRQQGLNSQPTRTKTTFTGTLRHIKSEKAQL